MYEASVKSLEFGHKHDDNESHINEVVDKYVDNSLLGLFRGQQNEEQRLKIFRKAMGGSEKFVSYLKENKRRVVKAVVDGGHCELLTALVKELSIEKEMLRNHKGEYRVRSIIFTYNTIYFFQILSCG